MQQILKGIWVIRSQMMQLLIFETQKATKSIQDHLDSQLQSRGLQVSPKPLVRNRVKGYLEKRFWFQIRKIQLTFLALQDLRVPKIRREWRRQFRALQNLPDLREMHRGGR